MCVETAAVGTSVSALLSYREQLQAARQNLKRVQRQRTRALSAAIGFALGLALLITAALLYIPPFWLAAATSAILAARSFQRYTQAGEVWKKLDSRCEFLERGIERLTNIWQGNGKDGLEFARDHHLYQHDLDILGTGSLFELLCTTRTSAGAERLASYLLDPAPIKESRSRQHSVRELHGEHELRLRIHALGRFRFQDANAAAFADWLATPPLKTPDWLRGLLLGSSAASLLSAVAMFAGIAAWIHWWPLLVSLVLLQLSIAATRFRAVRSSLKQLRPLTGAFSVLRQGLELMEQQQFQSPKLKALAEQLRAEHASTHVHTAERLFSILEQRDKVEFYALALLFAAGTQAVLAIEQWRAAFQTNLTAWLDAWADFEALAALAGYAYEHPECTFPELVEGAPFFGAKQLGHPLLPAESCVGNDLCLGPPEARVLIISGSNMAGKSTLLRAIGLNAVLAMAGAPVRAEHLRLSRLTLSASLAVTDSLLTGKSKFLAEVDRLRETLAQARAGEPVLFLIDEILSGTNSGDRKLAVELLLKRLVHDGAIGALSTHDLALTQIASNIGAVLAHMTNQHPDDPLSFDFRLRPGISTRTNAMGIVNLIGISDP